MLWKKGAKRMWAGVAILGLGLVLLGRTGHFFRALLWSGAGGLAGLLIIHFTGTLTGVSLPLTPWNLAVSSVLGLPGVLVLLLFPLLLV